ncbi:MAG: tRNA preQ1(34) S-adenosylmethionine ribosyltransferase-isomerase QueA [Negativicoccus succinicivorans]|uniref:tRNA preQ1(34) S-adenosylmethionine ribosyltransferase-isomerase QueA n=1 Tax=Negativicoccus succinicivorans TaxID=620903 RepID=UPI0026EBA9EE|nr:tRNA preQ1(34) S-adenosylmethionine ribosyltransferase-isomerase QueA [Negativicoccus succinicivorans]MBS5888151.1 tRNA preQ1(34) S-adenosylmethionine ribosyltransferase-isomerase QueA [Negativicoccus succinicivorans]MDU3214300.1 tRNA preQ1(34) S-adenosylmethionine ribosyltransferase-isomerase QueA [Negativicoccus succinicivorans]
MNVSEFNYDLPEELIAQTPVEPRDTSRLLTLDRQTGATKQGTFRDILADVRPDDVWVFNNTRVIPARLYGKRPTGGRVEVLLLHPLGEDRWEVLVRPGKKALLGTALTFDAGVTATVEDRTDFGGRVLKFTYDGDFYERLDEIGEMPLPPYIHERLQDRERYQTVYSKTPGSAAAPTAGLHFTPEVLEEIAARGATVCYVTLDVGLGTFRPVSVTQIEAHHMHSETYNVSEETARLINEAKRAGRRIVAVGTTSVRTLEAAGQSGVVKAGSGATELFIYPGYEFKIVDAMVTNFHLPQSTLLMMISAFAGKDHVLAAYREAVAAKYRFFSFGDAMWIR